MQMATQYKGFGQILASSSQMRVQTFLSRPYSRTGSSRSGGEALVCGLSISPTLKRKA